MALFDIFRRSAVAEASAPGGSTRPGLPMRRAARSANFTAAKHDRLTASWPSTPMTADQVVLRNQRVLVARSREQAANNDYMRAFLRILRQNIVGSSGPMLQAQVTKANGSLDKETNDGLELSFAEWGRPENCDVTGKRSWRAMVRSAVNTAGKDGEFIFRMVYGPDAGPWGFALQSIDPQRCPVDLNEPARADGTFIRHGIRFNRYGRPLAYGFSTTDEKTAETQYYGPIAVQWIDAADIIHGFVEDMEGQKRGLPWGATGLFRMRNLNGFEDAVIVNARIGASKMGFIQWEQGTGPELEDGEDVPEIDAEPGVFETLPEGAKIQDWSPQFPDASVGPFTKSMLRGVAAGFGTPYNELAADLEGVNFSSIRQGTLDAREHWKELQEWLIETLCQRVYRAWLAYSLLAGKLTTAKGRPLLASRVDKYLAHTFQGRRWEWIDPNADTKSAVDRKNNFLTSPSSIIREQGKDPSAVWDETANDIRAMIDALVAKGIKEDAAQELVLQSMRVQPAPKPVPDGKQNEPANAPAAA